MAPSSAAVVASVAVLAASWAVLNVFMTPDAVVNAPPIRVVAAPAAVIAGPYFWPNEAAASSTFALRASMRPVNVSAAAAAWPCSLVDRPVMASAWLWAALPARVVASAIFLWAAAAAAAAATTFCWALRNSCCWAMVRRPWPAAVASAAEYLPWAAATWVVALVTAKWAFCRANSWDRVSFFLVASTAISWFRWRWAAARRSWAAATPAVEMIACLFDPASRACRSTRCCLASAARWSAAAACLVADSRALVATDALVPAAMPNSFNSLVLPL